MAGTSIYGTFSEEALEQRAGLERRIASLSESIAETRSAREAAEAELTAVTARSSHIETEFTAAQRTLEDVTAAFTRSNRDTKQADRRLAELIASEESTRRKFTEASEAAAQFKAAEEFTVRSRSQAEERLTQLRDQIAALTAEVAVAEQRAAEERSAEERAARERATAEHRAAELQRTLERITMELATYEEQIAEQHRVRDEADSQIAAAQARFDEISPKFDEVLRAREAAQAVLDGHRSNETYLVAERTNAVAELHAFDQEQERRVIDHRLSSLRDAEEAAARELADLEAQLRDFRDAESRAAEERVHLEAIRPVEVSEPPKPPEPVAAPTVAGHLDAEEADVAGRESIGRARPNLQLVSNSAMRAYSESPAGTEPPTPQPAISPMRMSSVQTRKTAFNLFGWGKRQGSSEPEAPAVEDSISVADRIARDFGNLGNSQTEPPPPT